MKYILAALILILTSLKGLGQANSIDTVAAEIMVSNANGKLYIINGYVEVYNTYSLGDVAFFDDKKRPLDNTLTVWDYRLKKYKAAIK